MTNGKNIQSVIDDIQPIIDDGIQPIIDENVFSTVKILVSDQNWIFVGYDRLS